MEDRKAKGGIAALRFSPDSRALGVASADGRLYIHDATEKFQLKATLAPAGLPPMSAAAASVNAGLSALTHFDFSADGSLARTNSFGRLPVICKCDFYLFNLKLIFFCMFES